MSVSDTTEQSIMVREHLIRTSARERNKVIITEGKNSEHFYSRPFWEFVPNLLNIRALALRNNLNPLKINGNYVCPRFLNNL
jgi:hypothetical protein